MLVTNRNNKIITGVVVLIICCLAGHAFSKIYQPKEKSIQIYKQALKDYDNQNYSNSYYLFSKIGYSSHLKPIAIYRQALCAKALGDKNSEVKRYQQLFKFYPKNKLTPEAKYLAGQLLIDDKPNVALRYFKSVSKSNLDEDYKIASNYYKARIEASKIRYSNGKRKISEKKRQELESAFRTYLEKYPEGRLATGVAKTWQKFSPEMTSYDNALVARAYSLAKKYKEAEALFRGSEPKDIWAIQATNNYATKNYSKAKSLIEMGVSRLAQDVDVKDFNRAVDAYISIFAGEKYSASSRLLAMAKTDKKDYIWNLKCENAQPTDKFACYSGLYKAFPDSKYSENAMVQTLLIGVKNNNNENSRIVAKEFIKKYPTSENIPMVLFWAGKVEQRLGLLTSAANYFQKIINEYPDTYYAYRSYWLLKGVTKSTFLAKLEHKPVVYPYRKPSSNTILYDLMEVNDYDMILKFTDDGFISSWVEYERGNYATSMVLASEAMAKLKQKPAKNDLRWRLVYPQIFYKQVQNWSEKYNNNPALIMAIIREESHFNSEAQSSVGAIGLMQLMPSTAHDIGSNLGINFNTSYLFNPELNLRLGNVYYSSLKQILNGNDILAIAAYNGGVGSVTRWKSNLQYTDVDEFVEQIPYDETKNYVMKVFRSYWNYTRIYQDPKPIIKPEPIKPPVQTPPPVQKPKVKTVEPEFEDELLGPSGPKPLTFDEDERKPLVIVPGAR